MRHHVPRSALVARIVFLILFLLLWEAAGRSNAPALGAIAPVSAVLTSWAGYATAGTFWSAIGSTLLQWAVGLLLAVVVAVPAGLLIGSSRLGTDYTRSTIDILRTIPPVMLLPLFVLVWGSGLQMVALLALYAAVWPLLTQTIAGVAAIESLTLDTARVFHISAWRRFAYIKLPAVAPFMFSGLRVSAVISLFIAVVCELIAGSPGLGGLLTDAQLAGDHAGIFALIITAGLLGVLINAVVAVAEMRILVWHESQNQGAH